MKGYKTVAVLVLPCTTCSSTHMGLAFTVMGSEQVRLHVLFAGVFPLIVLAIMPMVFVQSKFCKHACFHVCTAWVSHGGLKIHQHTHVSKYLPCNKLPYMGLGFTAIGETAFALCWPSSHLQYLQLLLCNDPGSRVVMRSQGTHAAG